MNFTQNDLQQIEKKGLTINVVENQIAIFKSGIPYSNIYEAATIANGIIGHDDTSFEASIEFFNTQKSGLDILKFVPASGAATRMFKFLFQFVKDYDPKTETLDAYSDRTDSKNIMRFFKGIENFPFYDQVLKKLTVKEVHFSKLSNGEKLWHFADTMLGEDLLDFGNFPKGLLPFHEYSNYISTAFEEHLYEAALYASDKNIAKLHFTISERHKVKFENEFKRVKAKVEVETGVTFDVSFSYQQEATDTIAVTPNDEPFRNDDGSLLFRPSGHGALLKNLDALNADVIFIKNIDNVVVQRYKDYIEKYKKVLAGILLELQAKSFEFLNDLDNKNTSEAKLEEMEAFLKNKLYVKLSDTYKTSSDNDKIEFLHQKLNRPIRVCGMVKNEGEPGGGPFWVKDQNGDVSLQIVESAQINQADSAQKAILQNATHFNPVDLVCGVKNYKGKKFNLEEFVNHKAAFITSKTKEGKDLKALELPGLWNGSMAFWNTIFVEVPVITFNPVKTVNDLLKEPHQIKF